MVNRVKRIHPLKRLLNHSFMPHWRVKQAFSNDALRHIEQAITVSELSHSGQVRFAIEASLSLHQLIAKLKPSHRAIQVFSDLRVWDTEQNNGVLIYLLLADRDVEIVADRGIHQHVGTDNWEAICLQMESRFKLGDFEAGVIEGIQSITKHLEQYSPNESASQDPAHKINHKAKKNELSDKPVII